MIDVNPLVILLVMFGSLVGLLLAGMPVLLAMGSIGVLVALIFLKSEFLTSLVAGNAFDIMSFYSLIAIPLFVFMSSVLELSGIGEDMFHCFRLWLDRVPGGLAVAVIGVSVLIAAMSGVVASGIVILGIIAVPIMLKFGYSKEMAIGPVLAGACLASLIPPSMAFIVYGSLAQVSVGQLFVGGIIPGIILASLFALYIIIRCYLNPNIAPRLAPEERAGWRVKFASLRGLILPFCLIAAVLGAIFLGVASPTESASIGAVGALACAAVKHNLRWGDVRQTLIRTLNISGMVLWVFIGAYCFKGVFVISGGPQLVTDWVSGLGLGPTAVVGIMQISFIIMGCFVQEIVIQLISLPVFFPLLDYFGLSRLWFGVLFLTNIQMSYLTPPFGFALFYMRGIAPEGVSMRDIIRSILPFLPLQAITVLIVMFFPEVALWLPSLMLR